MTLAKVLSSAVLGIDAYLVDVEEEGWACARLEDREQVTPAWPGGDP